MVDKKYSGTVRCYVQLPIAMVDKCDKLVSDGLFVSRGGVILRSVEYYMCRGRGRKYNPASRRECLARNDLKMRLTALNK